MTDPGGAETVMKQPTAQVTHGESEREEKKKEPAGLAIDLEWLLLRNVLIN